MRGLAMRARPAATADAGARKLPSARPALRLVGSPGHPPARLGEALLASGAVTPSDLVRALAIQAREGGRLGAILCAHGMITPEALLHALSRQFHAGIITAADRQPDPRLVDLLGAARCLQLQCLPWARAGGVCIVATPEPDRFEAQRPALEAALGPVAMALISADALEQAIVNMRGSALRVQAETCVRASESCRDWVARGVHRWLAAGIAATLTALLLAPIVTLWALVILATLSLLAQSALKLAATFAALRRGTDTPALCEDASPSSAGPLPVVSIMVPMFHEVDSLARLVNRLSRLSYPRDRLDVLLVVEEADAATRAALATLGAPAWMRVIVVPDGPLRTKPRALNFALAFARGSIIGVYDTEDAPEPDQLRRVVARFSRAGPELACIQGVLDYYNPATNWLSRCFTIEYATWFRMLLPGKARLGLVLPLGGTTLFFRRAALEHLGGWDAHNVTEDADLGIRLVRYGYHTTILRSTTFEEANCHALPWIRQRSRWLKGYAITYLVHMRDPSELLRQLGLRRFVAFQVQFLGTLLQVLLMPVLLSFWAIMLGLGHPLQGAGPGWLVPALAAGFVVSLLIDLWISARALGAPHHRALRPWVLALPLYHPLAAIAAAKALLELIRAPFYWDKTSHGHYGAGIDTAQVAVTGMRTPRSCTQR